MKKKTKFSAAKSAWPIAVGFLIVGAVVGYVFYSSTVEEKKKTSQDNVRAIASNAFQFSNSKMSVFPDSAGDLIRLQYVRPEQFLSPWSDQTLPDNFDEMPEQERVDWINEHTDYVYLISGRRIRGDDTIIAFELDPRGKLDDVAIAMYRDVSEKGERYDWGRPVPRGAAPRIPYDEADALIKAQTGYSIEEWHDAELPGAGLMTGELVPRPESEHHIPRS